MEAGVTPACNQLHARDTHRGNIAQGILICLEQFGIEEKNLVCAVHDQASRMVVEENLLKKIAMLSSSTLCCTSLASACHTSIGTGAYCIAFV